MRVYCIYLIRLLFCSYTSLFIVHFALKILFEVSGMLNNSDGITGMTFFDDITVIA